MFGFWLRKLCGTLILVVRAEKHVCSQQNGVRSGNSRCVVHCFSSSHLLFLSLSFFHSLIQFNSISVVWWFWKFVCLFFFLSIFYSGLYCCRFYLILFFGNLTRCCYSRAIAMNAVATGVVMLFVVSWVCVSLSLSLCESCVLCSFFILIMLKWCWHSVG